MSLITPSNFTHLAAMEQFCDAIRHCGLEPPPQLKPGTLHTFPGIRNIAEGLDGWCFLFADYSGGCYGDWSTGKHDLWRPASTLTLPSTVRKDLAQQLYLALRRQQITADIDTGSATERTITINLQS